MTESLTKTRGRQTIGATLAMTDAFRDLEDINPTTKRVDGCAARGGIPDSHTKQYNQYYQQAKRRLRRDNPDMDERELEGQALVYAIDSTNAHMGQDEQVSIINNDKIGRAKNVILQVAGAEGLGWKKARGIAQMMIGYFTDTRALRQLDDVKHYDGLSVEGISHSKFVDYYADLDPLHKAAPKTFSFGQLSEVNFDNLVDAIMNGVDNETSAMAGAWREVSERMRRDFNEAVGVEAIPHREDWHMPQVHPTLELAKLGKEGWVKLIQPLITDMDGFEVSAEVLGRSYDKIMNENINAPIHHRQRHYKFKDAKKWREYHKAVNRENVYDVLMSHVRMMARKVAVVRIMGTNPKLWQDEILNTLDGQGGTWAQSDERFRRLVRKAVGVYDAVAAPDENVAEGFKVEAGKFGKAKDMTKDIMLKLPQLRGMASVWNMAYSVFSVPAEIGLQMYQGGLFNIPAMRHMMGITKTLRGGREQARQHAIRLRFMLDSTMSKMRAINRFSGEVFEPGKLNMAKNVMLESTGFMAAVDMMKTNNAMVWLEWMSEHMNRGFNDLPAQMQDGLRGAGIGPKQWNAAKEQFDAGASVDIEWGGEVAKFIDPAKLTGDTRLAWLSAVGQLTELGSGNSNFWTDTAIGGEGQRGEFWREVREWSGMLMRHPITITQNILIPAWRRPGQRQRAAAIFLGMAMMGYARYELTHYLRHGESAPPPETGADYVNRAMVAIAYGGGAGMVGEWFFAPPQYGGGSPIERTVGSVGWNLLEDIRQGGFGAAGDFIDYTLLDKNAEELGKERKAWYKSIAESSPFWQSDLILRRLIADSIYSANKTSDVFGNR